MLTPVLVEDVDSEECVAVARGIFPVASVWISLLSKVCPGIRGLEDVPLFFRYSGDTDSRSLDIFSVDGLPEALLDFHG